MPSGLVVLVLLAAWEWWAQGTAEREFLFSKPSAILSALRTDLLAAELWYDIGLTATEILLGLTLSTTIGTALGLIAWSAGPIARIAKPIVAVVGAIPIVAIAPMLIIWVGTEFWGKVLMAAFACAGISFGQVFEGATDSFERFWRLSGALRCTRRQVIRYFVWPGAIRWVVAGAGFNVGLATIGAFTAEFVSSEAGLGHHILRSAGRYDSARVLGGVALLAAISVTLTWGIRRVGKWLSTSL